MAKFSFMGVTLTSTKITFGVIVLTVLTALAFYSVMALAFWGIAELVIYAFNIEFNATYLHGVIATIAYILLASIFKGDK